MSYEAFISRLAILQAKKQVISMTDIHNLQGIIAQSPILNRLHEGPHYGAANGAQILNIIEQRKVNQRLSSVRQLEELSNTEREETRKRRMKKAEEEKLIDITI